MLVVHAGKTIESKKSKGEIQVRPHSHKGSISKERSLLELCQGQARTIERVGVLKPWQVSLSVSARI